MRPNFITKEDIERWDENINNDPLLPPGFADEPARREVCYAGLWLNEQLNSLGCEYEEIMTLQYTAGKLSYNNDPWEVHQTTFEMYSKYFEETKNALNKEDLN